MSNRYLICRVQRPYRIIGFFFQDINARHIWSSIILLFIVLFANLSVYSTASAESTFPSWLHGTLCINLLGSDELTDQPVDQYILLLNFDTKQKELIKIPAGSTIMNNPDNSAPLIVRRSTINGRVLKDSYIGYYEIWQIDPDKEISFVKRFNLEMPLQISYVSVINDNGKLQTYSELLDSWKIETYGVYYLMPSTGTSGITSVRLAYTKTNSSQIDYIGNFTNNANETIAVSKQGDIVWIEHDSVPILCVNGQSRISLTGEDIITSPYWYDNNTVLFTSFDGETSTVKMCNIETGKISNINSLWNGSNVDIPGIVGPFDINYRDNIAAMILPNASSVYVNPYDDPILFINLNTGESFLWTPWFYKNNSCGLFYGKDDGEKYYYQPSMMPINRIAWWIQ